MHQASVGFHCPECSKKGRQKVYTSSSMMTRPVATIAIIAINVAVFVVEMVASAGSAAGGRDLGSFGEDGAILGTGELVNRFGVVVETIGVSTGEWWRVVTGGFLHAGLFHLGMNMLLLWYLGQMLEPALGKVKFVALYFVALLGGSFLVLTISPDTPTVGASGAVFGLLGAAFVGLRARGIDPFSTGIGGLIMINLVITFAFSRYISVGGHVGGLIAGAAAGWVLLDWAPRVKNGATIATVGCFAACPILYGASIWISYNPVF